MGLKGQQLIKTISNIHAADVTCLEINHSATTALTGGADNRVYLWDLESGKKLRSFAAQKGTITDIAYNHNESLFATASRDNTIIVWDAESYKPKKILRGHEAAVLALAFHPVEDELASLDETGTLIFWDAGSGKSTNTVDANFQGKIQSAFIHHDSKKLVVASGGQANIYSSNGDLEKALFLTEVLNANHLYTSGYCYLLTTDGVVSVNLNTGSIIELPETKIKKATAVAVALNEQSILGTETGEWFLGSKSTDAHSETIVDMALNYNNSKLVTASNDKKLKVWDVANFDLSKKSAYDQNSASIADVKLVDENGNGLVDEQENAGIYYNINNKTTDELNNLALEFYSDDLPDGIKLPASVKVGSINPNGSINGTAALEIGSSVAAGSSNIQLQLVNGATVLNTYQFRLQSGSTANAGVEVISHQFSSPSGKAKAGEPITLYVVLQNITRIAAEDVQVRFSLPDNIRVIDKTQETLKLIPAMQGAEVSMQFFIDNLAPGEVANIAIEIDGVSYSNAADMDFQIKMGQQIRKPDELVMLASQSTSTNNLNRGASLEFETPKLAVPIESSSYTALVIGIDNYTGTWNKLSNAVNDAKAVERVLKSDYGFNNVRTLYNEDASRVNIIKEMEWLVENVDEDDNLLIYYSGHGEFKEALNKGYWVPADAKTNSTAQYISNSDIQTFLNGIPAKHTLLISDACFSGDIFRGGQNTETTNTSSKYYNRVFSLKSRQAITSGGIEPVMDGGKDGHSVFTYYLLQALQNNKNSYLDAGQLFEKLKVPVVNNSEQAPKFSPIKNTGDEGGQFVFFKKG